MTVQGQLRRYIVEHQLRPGDRLPSEAELVASLGSSRVVVRESLRSLEALGLLESRSGSGWYVRPFEVSAAARSFARSLAFYPAALLDLLAVRRGVEADLVPQLAGRLSADDLEALDELADRMCWRAARSEPFDSEDGAFHRRLIAATGNVLALALVDLYWGVMAALYERGFPPPAQESLPSTAASHVAIVDALRQGDGDLPPRLLNQGQAEAERRFRGWLASQREPYGPDGPGTSAVTEALQAALLWPGLGGAE